MASKADAEKALEAIKLRVAANPSLISARCKALEEHVDECEATLAIKVQDLRDLNDKFADKEAEIAKFEAAHAKKSKEIQGNIDTAAELLDGLKSDVANNNTEVNTKRATKTQKTEKTDTDEQNIEKMKVTQSEKESMISQLEAAGTENREQIAELEEAATQLAAELDEVLQTIEDSRAKIDKYTSERAGMKSAVPGNVKKTTK
eukprot:CAMPEP_0172596854 /NCGR_PEP_ID=MMETSP1068-20121228/16720_1 /TAXON_ID=35684 /ORGANISM="Pseudopedinella elastica, Strain CCMP716" /LENGTH=203 /DNA_ID=CAMNT_0013396083 /DNA_START=86 /DNA_END=700 /DNA_ORIENTATION=-